MLAHPPETYDPRALQHPRNLRRGRLQQVRLIANPNLVDAVSRQPLVQPARPVMSLAPTSLKWGKVAVGVTSGAKKVVATNSGTSTLSITNLATTGDFALVAVKQTKKVTPCANGTNPGPAQPAKSKSASPPHKQECEPAASTSLTTPPAARKAYR